MNKKVKWTFLPTFVIFLLFISILLITQNRILRIDYNEVNKIELSTFDRKVSTIVDDNEIRDICNGLNGAKEIGYPTSCGFGHHRITIHKESEDFDIYMADDGCSAVYYNKKYYGISESTNKMLRGIFIKYGFKSVRT